MSATMTREPGTPGIEVRVYDGATLLVRELCGSEDDTGAIVDRWSDVGNLFVVADLPPSGVVAHPAPAPAGSDEVDEDEGLTIATAVVHARGDE
jgi:hypothetical protein